MGPRQYVTYHYLLADHVEEKLPALRMPNFVVRGGRDLTVTQRWAEQAIRLLPGGRLAVMPGAAHAVDYNAAPALVRLAPVACSTYHRE